MFYCKVIFSKWSNPIIINSSGLPKDVCTFINNFSSVRALLGFLCCCCCCFCNIYTEHVRSDRSPHGVRHERKLSVHLRHIFNMEGGRSKRGKSEKSIL